MSKFIALNRVAKTHLAMGKIIINLDFIYSKQVKIYVFE